MCLLNLKYILSISDFVLFFSQRTLRDVQNIVSVSLKKKANLWFQGVENFGLEKIMDLWVLMQPEDKRKNGESLSAWRFYNLRLTV